DRLYQRYLFRPADPGGRLLWTSQLLSNPAFRLEDLIAGLAGSDEYWARRGASDNGKFIQAIYYDILRRPPDPSGYTNWLSQLNNGTAARVQVATALAKSAEYYTGYINDQYQRLLGRGVDSGGLNTWLNPLVNQQIRGEDFQAALVGSQEYWNN